MYARYEIQRIAMELDDEDRPLKLENPRKWHDSFSKNFQKTAQPVDSPK